MKLLVSLALSVALLAAPTSALGRSGGQGGGHGHGGHGFHGHRHHHFHGRGGGIAFPFWFYDGPLYYYDPLGTYPSDALIYDPQTEAVWVPGHWELFTNWVWIPGRWER